MACQEGGSWKPLCLLLGGGGERTACPFAMCQALLYPDKICARKATPMFLGYGAASQVCPRPTRQMISHAQGRDRESTGCPGLYSLSAWTFEGIVQACSWLTFLRTQDACRARPLGGRRHRRQRSSLSQSSVAALGSDVCNPPHPTPGIADQTQPGPRAPALPGTWRGASSCGVS